MQLRNARLCLDCEEIHDGAHCPVCASESFAFIRRWVPSPERRAKPRDDAEAPSKEVLDTYREMLAPDRKGTSATWRLVKGGTVGLALLGVAGWMWRRNTRSQNHAEKHESRERGKTA